MRRIEGYKGQGGPKQMRYGEVNCLKIKGF